MTQRSKANVKQRFNRMFVESSDYDYQENVISKQPSKKSGDPFPFEILLTIILSVVFALFVVGFVATRFLINTNRRRKDSKDSNYSLSRYWRRQLVSVSFDSINPSTSTNINTVLTHHDTNEMSRIMKSSFSWP
ncbi:unnamed protein product, partial [Rotaria socialis]